MQRSGVLAVLFVFLGASRLFAQLDLRDLVKEKLVAIKDSPRVAALQPKNFTYEFNVVAKPEAVAKFGQGQGFVVAQLRAGTVIRGTGRQSELLVARTSNVYMTTGTEITVRNIPVYSLRVGEVPPSGRVTLAPLVGPARYLFDDQSLGDEMTPGAGFQKHHVIKQYALFRAGRGFSPRSYAQVYGHRNYQLSKAETAQATKMVTAAKKSHLEDSRYIGELEKQAKSEKDPIAMITLAELSIAGQRGVPIDRRRAVDWFEQAANAGSAHAKHQLAVLYSAPIPPGRDLPKMLYWLKQAAHAGHAAAMTDMGDAYRRSLGMARADSKIAEQWYQKAADAGDPRAKRRLDYLRKAPSRQTAFLALIGTAIYLGSQSGRGSGQLHYDNAGNTYRSEQAAVQSNIDMYETARSFRGR